MLISVSYTMTLGMLILPVSTFSSIFELMSLLRSNFTLYSDTMALRTGYEPWDHERTVYLAIGSVHLRTLSSGKSFNFCTHPGPSSNRNDQLIMVSYESSVAWTLIDNTMVSMYNS